ncbi:MAG: hypothetical protein ACHQX3_05370, partial [Nitrospirales bacterium]
MSDIPIGNLAGYITLDDLASKTMLEVATNLDKLGAKFDDLGRKVRQIGVSFLPMSAGIATAGGAVLK